MVVLFTTLDMFQKGVVILVTTIMLISESTIQSNPAFFLYINVYAFVLIYEIFGLIYGDVALLVLVLFVLVVLVAFVVEILRILFVVVPEIALKHFVVVPEIALKHFVVEFENLEMRLLLGPYILLKYKILNLL